MFAFTSAGASTSVTRRALSHFGKLQVVPCVLMADPLDSGDDVSATIKPQAIKYIHANVTPLLDL